MICKLAMTILVLCHTHSAAVCYTTTGKEINGYIDERSTAVTPDTCRGVYLCPLHTRIHIQVHVCPKRKQRCRLIREILAKHIYVQYVIQRKGMISGGLKCPVFSILIMQPAWLSIPYVLLIKHEEYLVPCSNNMIMHYKTPECQKLCLTCHKLKCLEKSKYD